MIKIFIDLDGVVINTIKTIVNLYNEDHIFFKDFVPVDWKNIKTWDFTELNLVSKEYIDKYFCTPRFFQKCELMIGAKWIIHKLAEDYSIIFCSSGRYPNLQLKRRWVRSQFSVGDFIPVELPTYIDKSHIDMSDSIFIDDCSSNLQTSNALVKICFGEIYDWNKDWNGIRCEDWITTYNYITKRGDFEC